MSKVLVVYWSGTGNTQAMAEAVAEGAGESTLLSVDAASADTVKEYTSIAFGCPSMGDEVLEDGEMEPFFAGVESLLSGKNVGLFGSYDWGDGQWMRDWQERVKAAGANLVQDGVIANLTPGDDELNSCKALGQALAAL